MIVIAPGQVAGVEEIIGFIMEQTGGTCLYQVDDHPECKEYPEYMPAIL
jgi:hypothetical protein